MGHERVLEMGVGARKMHDGPDGFAKGEVELTGVLNGLRPVIEAMRSIRQRLITRRRQAQFVQTLYKLLDY